jgi:glycosyltransferase involved in cell wall biosynthesis
VLLVRVIAKLEPGGAQLSALRLAAPLREAGIRTRVLAGHATPDGLALCEQHGVPVEAFSGGAEMQYACDRGFARWLRPLLEDADVVHGHMFGGWWAAAQATPARVPLVASEHNAVRWPKRPRTREMRSALRRVDLFFAHGPEARRLVLELGLPVDRLRSGIAPVAGLDARPRAGLPSPRIVFAGRLHPEKGPDLLIQALAAMDRPPPTLMLGSGEMEDELRRAVRKARLHRVVRFLGWQPQPASFMAGASAVVVPSRHEAWSQVAVTAMGLGVPVVGCAVEGLPITLGAGRGMLVPPADPVALARALDDVIAGRRSVDHGEARAYAFRFSPERVAAVYGSAYRALVAREELAATSAA